MNDFEINLMSQRLNVAVLFLVFNRLDNTRAVFEQIKKAKPPRIYIASDGPRKDKVDEGLVVQDVRSYILSGVDWDCEVFTLFRDSNLGCGIAVSQAISWFFEHEEMGIILEDDCVPSQSFFGFCQEMLIKYKDNDKVSMICGTNYNSDLTNEPYYFFSKNFHMWGWASYRRFWQNYDFDMVSWGRDVGLKELCKHMSIFEAIYYGLNFDLVKLGFINTWDYQLMFACVRSGNFAILPSKNLITNIGIDGTHAVEKNNAHYLSRYDFDKKLLDYAKEGLLISYNYDKQFAKINFKPRLKETFRMMIKLALVKLNLYKYLKRNRLI